MTVLYPATLPLPQGDGYGLQPDDSTARTDMEAGPARVRQRFTAVPTRVPVRWRMTLGQYAVFEAWFAQLALTTWFDVSLLNGLDINTVSARFVGTYKADLVGGRNWDVAATLEVRALPQLTSAELEVASAYPPDDIISAAPVLHTLNHSTLPGYW